MYCIVVLSELRVYWGCIGVYCYSPIISGNKETPTLKNSTLAATGTSCLPGKYFPIIENVAIVTSAAPRPANKTEIKISFLRCQLLPAESGILPSTCRLTTSGGKKKQLVPM